MQFILSLDRAITENFFGSIVKKSGWSQYTWARIFLVLFFGFRMGFAFKDLQGKSFHLIPYVLIVNVILFHFANKFITKQKKQKSKISDIWKPVLIGFTITNTIFAKDLIYNVISSLLVIIIFYFLSDLSEHKEEETD